MNLKKIQNKVLDSIESIYKHSVLISKKWGKQSIPIVVLEEIIGKLKINAASMDLPKSVTFVPEYIKTLDMILDYCKGAAKKMNSTDCSKQYLRDVINEVKAGYKEGFKL